MCRYCNYESDDNRIFIDPLTNEYYLDINYCPMVWKKTDERMRYRYGKENY